MNVQLDYLYRDASNYKNRGEVIFANPKNWSLKKIEAKFESALIDGEFFMAEEVGISPVYFESTNEDDHEFHEFDCVTETQLEATDERSIDKFIRDLRNAKLRYKYPHRFAPRVSRSPKPISLITKSDLFPRLKAHLKRKGFSVQPRAAFDQKTDGYLESDKDFFEKNRNIAIYLLERLAENEGDASDL